MARKKPCGANSPHSFPVPGSTRQITALPDFFNASSAHGGYDRRISRGFNLLFITPALELTLASMTGLWNQAGFATGPKERQENVFAP
jgi:hypothetical protein